MKERPILFNTSMVQAILDGRKTQTRRPVKKEIAEHIEFVSASNDDNTEFDFLGLSYGECQLDNGKTEVPQWLVFCSEYPEEGVIPIGQGFGAVGDRLWVRETFCWGGYVKDHEDLLHRADCDYSLEERGDRPWTPSIHMPRWACRLVLEITDVRLERVQDITEKDAKAEGAKSLEDFQTLWGGVYPNSWENNEWVWAIEFKIVELNGKKQEQTA